MPGFPTDKPNINATIGQKALNLRTALDEIVHLNAVLQPLDLVAAGFTSDDSATIKQAYGVLNQFAQVFYGQAAIPTPVPIAPYTALFTGLV